MEKEQLTALVKKSQSGDTEAIEKLLQYAHTSVSYQCRKMLNNAQDAEDMTQEVLVTIYTKLDTLQEPAAFHRWVNQITATRCINALNRTHVEYQFAEDEEGHSVLDTLEELDEQVIPDKAIDNAETARMIEEIVEGLPDVQRAATLMFYYDEMSVKEIAKTMKVSENTVKSRLNYARKAIKEKVLDYEKQGVKLYGLSPLPFLLYFLRMAANLQKDKKAAGIMVAEVMAAESAAVGIAAGTGAAAAGASAATAVAGGAAAAGGTAAATGFFAGFSAKVVAGILAAVVTLGSVTAAVVPSLSDEPIEPTAAPTEATTVMETESTTAPAESEPMETEPVTTEPPETEAADTDNDQDSMQSATKPDSSEESANGDCPSCGKGNITLVLLTEPTCELRGEAAGKCSHCGYIAGYSYPPASGHNSDGITEDGQYEYCTGCGEIMGPVHIGHGGVTTETEHVHSYNSVVTPPTCTSGGYTTYTCACGDSYRSDETTATGHSMVETERVDYTCDTPGYYTMTCSACGYAETTEIPIHSYYVVAIHQACTTDGCHSVNKVWSCEFCEYLKIENIRDEPHDFEVVFICPCGPIGYTDYICKGCGYEHREHYDPTYPDHNLVPIEGAESGLYKCTQCGQNLYY